MLGLISASIELYLELTYHFDTGKMIGRARLTIEVDGALLLGHRHDQCRAAVRRLEGRPVVRRDDGRGDGSSELWTEYAAAFAPSGVRSGDARDLHRDRPAALDATRRRPRVAVHRAGLTTTGPRRRTLRDFPTFADWEPSLARGDGHARGPGRADREPGRSTRRGRALASVLRPGHAGGRRAAARLANRRGARSTPQRHDAGEGAAGGDVLASPTSHPPSTSTRSAP